MANDINSLLQPTVNGNNTQNVEQLQSLNSLASNFDNFLTILTTQLQNQDPLSPLDTHEFTNQLVMFADVEQSVRQSGQLDDLITLNRQNEATAAVEYIGRQITADHNEVNFQGQPVDLTYTMPEEADTAAMEIYDAQGELVSVITGIDKGLGKHTFTWDGKDQNGKSLPNGAYSFQIGAINADEQPIEKITYGIKGAVTGIEVNNGATTILMGDVRIPLERVQQVLTTQEQADAA